MTKQESKNKDEKARRQKLYRMPKQGCQSKEAEARMPKQGSRGKDAVTRKQWQGCRSKEAEVSR